MIDYVQSLWEEPSKENLNRVMMEMWRAADIVVNYHYLLSQITPNEITWSITQTEQVKKIYRQIADEELLISECREVVEKISKALENTK